MIIESYWLLKNVMSLYDYDYAQVSSAEIRKHSDKTSSYISEQWTYPRRLD